MEINFDDGYIVESLGIQDSWVYDIEVEDNHNFFANNILVHNSIYVNFQDLVEKSFKAVPLETNKVVDFLAKVCDDGGPFQGELTKIFNQVSKYTNSFDQKMYMKRESICDKAIWTGKKRYILNVYDKEQVRYTKPKIKISGLEAIKSSTPSGCRVKIKEAIDIIMKGKQDDIIKLIADFRQEFRELPIEAISFPKSVNGLEKYKTNVGLYIKGTPVNTKGSLIYNNEIEKRGLGAKYPLIQEGEKIKYVYIKEPNPFRNEVIAFPEKAPEEFDLTKYIDYSKMFDIAFLGPIKIILDPIRWKTEKVRSLGQFNRKVV